ncbi:MAG: GNAT family N-acetyltransferase [Micropruina sp.]|nr:GNAT family N-acetyltransferase [Micropruina sp.]
MPTLPKSARRAQIEAGRASDDNQQMLEITEVADDKSLRACLEVIHVAFGTVAAAHGWTRDTVPDYTAFLPWADYQAQARSGGRVFAAVRDGRIVGCATLLASRRTPHRFLLEKLAVLPDARHGGVGRRLVQRVAAEACALEGDTLGIAIVDEEVVLKNWYLALGFVQVRTATYAHLPFAVGYLDLSLAP